MGLSLLRLRFDFPKNSPRGQHPMSLFRHKILHYQAASSRYALYFHERGVMLRDQDIRQAFDPKSTIKAIHCVRMPPRNQNRPYLLYLLRRLKILLNRTETGDDRLALGCIDRNSLNPWCMTWCRNELNSREDLTASCNRNKL